MLNCYDNMCRWWGAGAAGSILTDYSVSPPLIGYAAGSGGGAGQCVTTTIKVAPFSYIDSIIGMGGTDEGRPTTVVYNDPASTYPQNQLIINAPGGYSGDTGILQSLSSFKPLHNSSGSYGGGGSAIIRYDPNKLPQDIQVGVHGGIGSRDFGDELTLPIPSTAGKGGDGGSSSVGNTSGVGGQNIYISDPIQIYSLGGGGGGATPGPVPPIDILTPYGNGAYYIVGSEPNSPVLVPSISGTLGSGGGGGAVYLTITSDGIVTSLVSGPERGGNGYSYIVFSP